MRLILLIDVPSANAAVGLVPSLTSLTDQSPFKKYILRHVYLFIFNRFIEV